MKETVSAWPDDAPSLALQRHRTRVQLLSQEGIMALQEGLFPIQNFRDEERFHRAPASWDHGATRAVKYQVEERLRKWRIDRAFLGEDWCSMSSDDRQAYKKLIGADVRQGCKYLCYCWRRSPSHVIPKPVTVVRYHDNTHDIEIDPAQAEELPIQQTVPKESLDVSLGRWNPSKGPRQLVWYPCSLEKFCKTQCEREMAQEVQRYPHCLCDTR